MCMRTRWSKVKYVVMDRINYRQVSVAKVCTILSALAWPWDCIGMSNLTRGIFRGNLSLTHSLTVKTLNQDCRYLTVHRQMPKSFSLCLNALPSFRLGQVTCTQRPVSLQPLYCFYNCGIWAPITLYCLAVLRMANVMQRLILFWFWFCFEDQIIRIIILY